MDDDDEGSRQDKNKPEEPPPRRRAKKIVVPQRELSVVIPPRQIIYTSSDKTTCAQCTCFPKEDPYVKSKKLIPCLRSPRTLYELTAEVVDQLRWPPAFKWTEEDVANWMEDVVGLPQYRQSILENHIDGLRLLILEDPSHLPQINIHYYHHIVMITKRVRQEFSVEFVRFARSIGLPPRKPLTHCTWFKSRTGPSWGIRVNWTRCDILRWMKILMPEPVYRDHWDLVWYHKPDFPKVKFARIANAKSDGNIPHYKPMRVVCNEYKVPRKFRLQCGISEDQQFIWMERRPGPQKGKKKERKIKILISEDSRLLPKRKSLTGLQGTDLILARRKMPKPKFLV